ncbi:S9 family peptidase [Candidatus Acetothermia bacterium]|nr:S9 family peptidase [Candidatus Acetothermia bacterium]
MPRAQKRLTPEDVLQFPWISDAQIDPTGKRIAYVSSSLMREKTKLAKQNIWLVDADGKNLRQLTNGPRADFHPRWSPDGQYLAFLSDRVEDGKLQIYLMSLEGGEALQITDVKGEIDTSRSKDTIQWSPDGRYLAFLMRDPETDEEKKKKEEKDDPIEFEKVHKFTRLWTLKLAAKKLQQVTRTDAQVWEFEWAPDGSEFALIISDHPYEWSWYHSRLARVSATGGTPKTVFKPKKRQIALPRWSPDQKQIAFLSSVLSDRGANQGNVFLVNADGGEPKDISPAYPGGIGWAEWTKNGRALLVCGYEQGEAAFGELDPKVGKVRTLWREPVALMENFWPKFSLSEHQKKIAVARSAPTDARNVWCAELENSKLNWKKLTDAVPNLKEFEPGEQEIISWKSRDGWEISGVLIKPAGYQKGKRYPMIVCSHGGPTSLVPNGFLITYWGQLLATKGYAVFLPNFRGSTGFGLKFAEANVGDMGGKDFEDIDSGVDFLIDKGIADPKRLGFGGWSYGGFMTCWTITQTNRYKAAVMGAGIANWLSFHGNSHLQAWDETHYDASPYERNGVYEKFSGIHYIKNVKTPTLILHGELDRDVPSEQSYQFYRALCDHGIETELVIYPREGHGISEKNHWLDLHKRIAAWYDRYVGGGGR